MNNFYACLLLSTLAILPTADSWADEITYFVTGQAIEPFRDDPNPAVNDPWGLGEAKAIEWSVTIDSSTVDMLSSISQASFGFGEVSLWIDGVGSGNGTGFLRFSDDVTFDIDDRIHVSSAEITLNGITSTMVLVADMEDDSTFEFTQSFEQLPIWSGQRLLDRGGDSGFIAGAYLGRVLEGAYATSTVRLVPEPLSTGMLGVAGVGWWVPRRRRPVSSCAK